MNEARRLKLKDSIEYMIYEGSRWDDGQFSIGTACQSKHKLDHPYLTVNP